MLIIPITTMIQMSSSTDKVPQVILFDNESYLKKLKMDIYNLIEAKLLANDTLSAIISYSGGCEKHDFTLAAVPNFTNSTTSPHIKLLLAHDNNGEMCKKIVKENLSFDLSPIKEKYQKDYGLKSGSVMLHLINRSITIKYVFN